MRLDWVVLNPLTGISEGEDRDPGRDPGTRDKMMQRPAKDRQGLSNTGGLEQGPGKDPASQPQEEPALPTARS